MGKIVCFHHNDTDGEAAAAIVNLKYPDKEKEFIPTSYPFSINALRFQFAIGIEHIFFVDLSFREGNIPELNELAKTGIPITWIDHHLSSKNVLDKHKDEFNPEINVVIDTNHCGAYLTYMYLHSNDDIIHNTTHCGVYSSHISDVSIPIFIRLVDVWDRHVTDSREWDAAVNFQYAITAVKNLQPTSDVWRELMVGGIPILDYHIKKGQIIAEYLQEYNRHIIEKTGVITSIRGIKCLAINYVGTSMVFDQVRSKFPICMAWRHTGSEYEYSIYTDRNDINCAAIAETFGGGGHPGAAGFHSEQLLFITEDCEEYTREE